MRAMLGYRHHHLRDACVARGGRFFLNDRRVQVRQGAHERERLCLLAFCASNRCRSVAFATFWRTPVMVIHLNTYVDGNWHTMRCGGRCEQGWIKCCLRLRAVRGQGSPADESHCGDRLTFRVWCAQIALPLKLQWWLGGCSGFTFAASAPMRGEVSIPRCAATALRNQVISHLSADALGPLKAQQVRQKSSPLDPASHAGLRRPQQIVVPVLQRLRAASACQDPVDPQGNGPWKAFSSCNSSTSDGSDCGTSPSTTTEPTSSVGR